MARFYSNQFSKRLINRIKNYFKKNILSFFNDKYITTEEDFLTIKSIDYLPSQRENAKIEIGNKKEKAFWESILEKQKDQHQKKSSSSI